MSCLIQDARKTEILTLFKDLGLVACGKKITEIFEFTNDKNVAVSLTVEEVENNGFAISPRSVQVPRRKTARFKITFTPQTPEVLYVQKYLVYDGTDVVARFTIRCESFGPFVSPKKFRLKFFTFRNKEATVKKLVIQNKSVCRAKFQIERGGKILPFSIEQKFGVLQGMGRFVLEVKFRPTEPGFYRKCVNLLLQYHAPILLYLIGVNKPNLKIQSNEPHFPGEKEEPKGGYEDYMRDLNESFEVKDFDPCSEFVHPNWAPVRFENKEEEEEPKSEDKPRKCEANIDSREKRKALLSDYYINLERDRSRRISFVNTSDSMMYFQWSFDNAINFSISPDTGNVAENVQLNMEVYFSPDIPDRLYSGEIDLRLYPLKNFSAGIEEPWPIAMTLSVVGNSFSDGGEWLEQCQVEPREVTLPPCIPGEIVYCTFLIKRRGHLPVVFQFIPPNDSCVKIKPPLGYIGDPYQIFVVQFDASNKPEGKYTETWRIAYNTSKSLHDEIVIKATIENPSITVGANNVFRFDTTLPEGVTKSAVPITNSTRFKIQYELHPPKNAPWFEIPVSSGVLEPLSDGTVNMIFKPLQTKEYFGDVCCLARTVKNPNYVMATKIELQGSCQDGFLVAIPQSHDFGKCLYDTIHKKIFHIFNFTSVLMNFRLFAVGDSYPGVDVKDEVKIYPDEGTIQGNHSLEVEVSVRTRRTETSKHVINCQLLPSSETEYNMSLGKTWPLFVITLEGIVPTFQIIDLNVESSGSLITPYWLWKMMDINRVNDILRTIKPGVEETIDMRMPDVTVHSPPVVVELLIKAKNSHKMSLCIKNIVKFHYCTTSTMSALKIEGENSMALSPLTLDLEPECEEILKMTLNYVVVGITHYEWTISLSQHRVLTLKTALHGLPRDETPPTSMYLEPEIRLKPIFIGDRNPPVQLFWLYNNTPNQTSYMLDKKNLRDQPPQRFGIVFECLNPHGVLPPFSSLPLMFLFAPNQLKQYKAQISLYLKVDHSLTLTLIGSGVLDHSYLRDLSEEKSLPETPILKPSHVSLEASVKMFAISPLSTFSNTRRLFVFENTSRDKVWAFQWHSFNVKDLIHAKVQPHEGKINPGEKILLTLIIESFVHPGSVTFSIPCDVIDYTALKIYENALHQKITTEKISEEMFTITEKGTINEAPEIVLPEKPNVRHVFVAIRANIVAEEDLEVKLHPSKILQLQAGEEIKQIVCKEMKMGEESARMVKETIEKLLWKVLNSSSFDRKLTNYIEGCGRTTYSQIRGGERETKELARRAYLQKCDIQSVLEAMIIDVLKKKFCE